ncbi:eukaryotic translation initiation factor 2C 2 [Amniculicola lignicola CBS 123094]|uniref:Eukaryotic translation initiation factor 2C 2 n=1 Tax=Amniculicola lignicola CBS 123094 TaxID=1392246 RepID=A0A6A5X5H2_9PLEO|nr:eukaryotic translation initiation factor 2C 2 [Amniculicola lignicola CBS 123094]
MGGPSKRHARAEKKASGSGPGSSEGQQSSSNALTQRSTPRSIPRIDGNRDPVAIGGRIPVEYSKANDLKNISEFLGMAGWYVARGYAIPDSLPSRPPKFNNFGREISLTLNTYNVLQSPSTPVHQYDVAWGQSTDATKRILIKKIWNSKAVKSALGEPLNLWIYDGNKLAWSGKKLDREETRIQVDLDAEEAQEAIAAGRTPRARSSEKKNVHQLFVRLTRTVDFAHLNAFLTGHASWSADCIDTVNFLDHVMREGPSQKYTQIKKSFFQRGEQRFDLGQGIEAFKGVFSSLRPVLNDKKEKCLSVNVDVANGTFWRAQELSRAIAQAFNTTPAKFQADFVNAKRDWRHSMLRKDLSRFKRLGVTATHNKSNLTQWTIDEFVGLDCHEAKFNDPDDKTNTKQISVYQYYKSKYNIECTPRLPVVRMTKKIRKGPVYIPMEHLRIDANQRYNSKLSDKQTSEMIKFAVTLPPARWQAVENGVKLLDWNNDKYLRHYGIKISPTPSKVKARVLPSPTLQFGPSVPNGKPATVPEKDLIQGRWRLDGKRFIQPNTREITAWGVCVISGRGGLPKPVVEKFASEFIRVYESHGGRFAAHPKFQKKPFICEGNLARGGEMVADAYNACGNYFNMRPMFMMFIVNDRNVEVYRRIKKSCDCRFGVASQVVQSRHVGAAQAQYISNVCMKVNAKLGGCTSYAASTTLPKINPKMKSIPTMVIGADVSHPAPGAGSDQAASFAALTVSSDVTLTRYWAECNTNGNRVEMVTTHNINQHLGNMIKNWMTRVGNGQPPQRVLYIRDGVSEGQYAAVLEEEVRDMKSAFLTQGAKAVPKFTVAIAGKRHHVRFFPEGPGRDRNGNPLPGTLVETGVTHPFEFDFYLCSHVAIKGTARPIHYQVILNEGEWEGPEIQQFLFEHSYHYVRSTTPVSLHPAVYYAHLAADRSRAHLNESPVSSGKKEANAPKQASNTGSSSKQKVEIAPLIGMGNFLGLKEAMWFV